MPYTLHGDSPPSSTDFLDRTYFVLTRFSKPGHVIPQRAAVCAFGGVKLRQFGRLAQTRDVGTLAAA